MKLNTLKGIYVLLTGGIGGLIKYLLDLFNTQVLAKIKNKDEVLKYSKDALALSAFLRTIIENHSDDFSAARKAAITSILAAVNQLAEALDDLEVNQDELDAIIDKVQEAIDAWKKAK